MHGMVELVGTYILSHLNIIFKNENLPEPEIERTRKVIVRVFKECRLSITTKVNLKVVNFLDIHLDLINGSYRPYRKLNGNLTYNDINSNYPPSIKKQIPISISKRISKLSSNEEIFNNNIRTYCDGFKRCRFQEKPVSISETPFDPHANKRRKCRRQIIGFNPPYTLNVKTNIGEVFLNLLHKHSPLTHLFHKIFNKSTVRIIYSCMSNMNSIISVHNWSFFNGPKTSYG